MLLRSRQLPPVLPPSASDGSEVADAVAVVPEVPSASGNVEELSSAETAESVVVDNAAEDASSSNTSPALRVRLREPVTVLPKTPGGLYVPFPKVVIPAEGDKKQKIAKQTQGTMFDRLETVQIPDEWVEDTPSPSDLQEKLEELYDAQTFLVDSYADVGVVLKNIFLVKLGFCLITIRDPRQFDFSCLLPKHMLGSNKTGCLVRMPPLLSFQRDEVMQSILSVCYYFLFFSLFPAFVFFFVFLLVSPLSSFYFTIANL